MSEADSALLGALLLRYVFLLASRRTNREPWFLYIDECHRYLTGDDDAWYSPYAYDDKEERAAQMRAYLAWELGLVAQLDRDDHFINPIDYAR